jgi:hypothetical protein
MMLALRADLLRSLGNMAESRIYNQVGWKFTKLV